MSAPAAHAADGSANKAIFPDGYKTSGQHEPIASKIQPFDKFPKDITGPTLWKAEDFRTNPEKWTHAFSGEEISELSTAADKFIASGLPLTAISKVKIQPS